MRNLRFILPILASALANCAVAQTFLGTKAGGGSVGLDSTSGGPGLGSYVHMLVALGVVLTLVKVDVPKVAGKMNR